MERMRQIPVRDASQHFPQEVPLRVLLSVKTSSVPAGMPAPVRPRQERPR